MTLKSSVAMVKGCLAGKFSPSSTAFTSLPEAITMILKFYKGRSEPPSNAQYLIVPNVQ